MTNPTIENILTPSANKHLPAVRMHMRNLADKRERLGAPFLKKKYRYLDGTWVLLHAMIGFNKIIMWGGGGYPHIVLTDYITAWIYDWYADKVVSKSFPDNPPNDILQEKVLPAFNGRTQLLDTVDMIARGGKWEANITAETGFPQDIHLLPATNDYELALMTDNIKTVYGRKDDKFGIVAELPKSIDKDWSVPYGGLMTMVTLGGAESVWNQLSPKMAYTVNPANRKVLESWYWTPAFFTVEPADDYFLKPGFYYGQYPAPTYDIDNPLESLTVKLVGLIAKRHNSAKYSSGWVEHVTEVNGLPVSDLYFYDEPLTVPSNPTFGRVRVAGTTADKYISTGWGGTGFKPATKLALDSTWAEPAVDIWNHDIWDDDQALLPEDKAGFTMVIYETKKGVAEQCEVYRYTGFWNKLLTLTIAPSYHSHAVSHNGQYLAVFEKAKDSANTIGNVHVWDLYGTREPTLAGEGNYTQAAPTKIIPVQPTEEQKATANPELLLLYEALEKEGSNATDIGAWTACIIPNREKVEDVEVEPQALGYDLAQAPEPTVFSSYNDYLPSMGYIRFSRRAQGNPVIMKVTCDDGVTAKFGISEDECFSSTIVIEDPDLGVKEEKLVGWWRGDTSGTTIKGVVRGSFVGNHPDMTFRGTGNGEVITKNETFSIIEFVDGTLGFDGYSGELFVGDCVEWISGAWRYAPECLECGEPFTATATSSCGQTAERDVEPDPHGPIVIDFTGGPWIQVGDFATASGGYGSYTYSISGGGAIDPDTGEILSTAGCGTGQVTAEDECGKSGSEDVAYPTGQWGDWFCIKESWYTKNCSSGWPTGTGPHDCHSPYEYPGVLREQKEWKGATTGASCSGLYPCEAPWISRAAADAVAGTLSCGCDGGYTGNCCECYRLAFTSYWRWIC